MALLLGRRAPRGRSVETPALLLPKAKAPKALGTAKSADMLRNCLACKHFMTCRDKKKAWNYACSNFKRLEDLDLATLAAEPEIIEPPRRRARANSAGVNLEAMVMDALDSGFDFPADTRIDDRDLPLAPNFYEWMNNKKFTNANVKLFPKQMQIALHLLGFYCPRCSDLGYLDDIPFDTRLDNILDHIQLLKFGKCPKCKGRKHEFVAGGEMNEYYELAACVGQRSGKSYLVSAIESFQLHHFLKTPNVHGALGIGSETELTATYSSLTFAQAKSNLFDVISNFVQGSKWFEEYHALLDDYGERLGTELYHFKEVFFKYKHRRLIGAPSGPNRGTMRGATRFSAVLDEIGLMPYGDENKDKVRMSAEGVYGSLTNSLKTLVPAHKKLLMRGHDYLPKPMASAISSPMDVNDMIMRMYRQAEAGSKTTYGFHSATWDFNPNQPRENFDNEFARDPIAAMRDFGAQPPMSSSAWVTEVSNVAACFAKKTQSIVKLKQFRFKAKSGATRTSGEVGVRDNGRPHILTLDSGYVNNSFAMSLSTYDFENRRVLITGCAELMPTKKAPISFTAVCNDVIMSLIEEANVVAVVCDHWQSLKLLEDLAEETGVTATQHKCIYADFEALREAVYEKNIMLPKLEMDAELAVRSEEGTYPSRFMGAPVAHLLYQMMTVRDVPGKTVEKGSGVTDDLFRTIVLAQWACTDPELQSLLTGPVQHTPMVLGYMASGGGGGNRSMSTPFGSTGSRAAWGSGSTSGGSRMVTSAGGGSFMGMSASRR